MDGSFCCALYGLQINSERPTKQFTVWSWASVEENTPKCVNVFFLSPNTLGVDWGCAQHTAFPNI